MLTTDALISLLKYECKLAGSIPKWCLQNHCEFHFVSNVIHGKASMTDELAMKLRYKPIVIWKKI